MLAKSTWMGGRPGVGRLRGAGEKRTPRIAQDLTEGYLSCAAFMKPGTKGATRVGGFLPKNSPSFFFLSSSVGGYHSYAAGSPSNQSGISTRCFCLPASARISAPWTVWGKKPKMSMMTRMPFSASAGPVVSVGRG